MVPAEHSPRANEVETAHTAEQRSEGADEVLKFQHVNFVRNGKSILTDVNFSVRVGEHWALLGPNGAGKTTILSMCGAQQHPTNGTVDVLGARLGRVEIRKLRESIGHVNPRHPLRSALTLEQVVLTGATGTIELMNRWEPGPDVHDRAGELIELLGLGHMRQARWPIMSQGERGRTLIARALLTDPPLLLLDEPSTGLDVAAREQFLKTIDLLHESKPELATVMVTHHLEELPVTTTHALLAKNGRVHAEGEAAQVLTTQLVSETFDYPIGIERQGGRWRASGQR